MSVIFILLTVSLLIAGGFLAAYLWSVKQGQYDDMFSASHRVLFDSENTIPPKNKSTDTLPKT